MAENRVRMQVVLQHDTYRRLTETVPLGSRSPLINAVLDLVLDQVNDVKMVAAMRERRVKLTEIPKDHSNES